MNINSFNGVRIAWKWCQNIKTAIFAVSNFIFSPKILTPYN